MVVNLKKDYLKLKEHGGNAKGREFVIGTRYAIQDPSVMTDMLLVRNLYATIFFDLAANRSFITPKNC